MIAIGWLMYIVVGICEPLMIVFFGGAMRDFVSVGKIGQACPEEDIHYLNETANGGKA